jgi:hypothetical protein
VTQTLTPAAWEAGDRVLNEDVVASTPAGTVATLIIRSWLDVVGGHWLATAGALSLTVLAVATMAAGLEKLLGKTGLALAAAMSILIGNPFAAAASGREMLPEPAGAFGQLLPPGVGGNLLRSTGFCDGAGAGGPSEIVGPGRRRCVRAVVATGERRRRR